MRLALHPIDQTEAAFEAASFLERERETMTTAKLNEKAAEKKSAMMREFGERAEREERRILGGYLAKLEEGGIYRDRAGADSILSIIETKNGNALCARIFISETSGSQWGLFEESLFDLALRMKSGELSPLKGFPHGLQVTMTPGAAYPAIWATSTFVHPAEPFLSKKREASRCDECGDDFKA